MRDQELAVKSEGITILLEAIDSIKEILLSIESERKEPEKNYDEIRERLDAFLENGGELKTASTTEKEPQPPCVEQEEGSLKTEPDTDPSAEEAQKPLTENTPLENSGLTQTGQDRVDQVEAEKMVANSPQNEEATPTPPSTTGIESVENTKSGLAESTIRVDVNLLDRLINLVGELVLSRNQLLQQVRDEENASSAKTNSGTIQQINLITTELQDTVMKTRMQPIKNVWDKFPRIIRDLARSNGKSVELVMEGAQTELDKTLLEAIKDPMTHIIRNAVDHGIELPDIRAKRGKREKGTLLLKSYHEGGRIMIQISDDGAGIDVDRVKAKALEKELLPQDVLDKMSQREALNLIFHPGLSTAQKITNVSGRGVGMDVVKTNIEKIGGTVNMSSRIGEGTEMRIEIPLTLAIIPALMVTSGGEPFAIPQASLTELVLVNSDSAQQIEIIHGAHFYRLRGVLLPLIYLNQVLELNDSGAHQDCVDILGINIVVLKINEQTFGLVVDVVNDSEEIVVKPLNRQLRNLPCLAGATIMGDGRVALILDVMGVADQGGLMDVQDHKVGLMDESEDQTEVKEIHETLILFSMSGEDQFAIPLSEIARLEEFQVDQIESSSGQEVIQYRDDLMPLIHLDEVIGVQTKHKHEDRIPVIVFMRHQKNIGLVVGRIIDIIESSSTIHHPTSHKTGFKGAIVVNGKSTDLIDIDQVLSCVMPKWEEECAV